MEVLPEPVPPAMPISMALDLGFLEVKGKW